MLIFFYKFIDNLKHTPAQKDKLVLITTGLSLALNLLIWGVIIFKFRPLVANLPPDQSFIPLHYNIYLGIDLYGHWQNIFILPALGLFFWLFNTILALILYSQKALISHLLCATTPLIQLFFLIGTSLTILMNI